MYCGCVSLLCISLLLQTIQSSQRGMKLPSAPLAPPGGSGSTVAQGAPHELNRSSSSPSSIFPNSMSALSSQVHRRDIHSGSSSPAGTQSASAADPRPENMGPRSVERRGNPAAAPPTAGWRLPPCPLLPARRSPSRRDSAGGGGGSLEWSSAELRSPMVIERPAGPPAAGPLTAPCASRGWLADPV